MSSVAIEDWGISSIDLTRVVHDDDLSFERFSFFSWVFFGIGGNVSSSDIFNRETFNVESYVISWDGFSELFVMHFDGFNVGGKSRGGELDGHTWF